MQYRFDKHIEKLLQTSEKPLKILVAVSGGPDSMCLLHLLHNSSLDISISIAHVNFHLRGEESCKDEALVREWALQNSVELFVKDVDTQTYAKEHFLSIEMAARELRYNWFGELRKEHGFDYVAVAHHANDNAETLLLNLVRGTGIQGICGMKELDSNSAILRPLLAYSRADVEKYVTKCSIPYRTDHTNLESDYYRNRIRNIIMPQLESINPSVVATLNRNMRYFAQSAGIVADAVKHKIELLKKSDCNGKSAFLDVVKNPIVKRYIIKESAPYLECYISVAELLKEKNCDFLLYEILNPYSFNSAQIEDFALVLQKQQRESKKMVSATHIAILERGFIKIYKKKNIIPTDNFLTISEFNGTKELYFNGRGYRLTLVPANDAIPLFEQIKGLYPLTLMLDADKLVYPLVLKNMEQGLKWHPFGMKGVKKLSDYLMDIKIDSLLKPNIPVLFNGPASDKKADSCGEKENPGNIVCLPGLQISNLYRVTENTGSVLIISLI